MVVQESPYEHENRKQTYMAGKAGRQFTTALSEVGIDVDDIYYTSVVKCSTPEDRLPLKDEIEACEDYLWAEIDVVKPEIIIPTGNVSLKVIANLTAITKHRGRLVETKDGLKVFPMIHPNMCLKQPKYLDMFAEDMITLESILNGTKVEGRISVGKERLYCEDLGSIREELTRLNSLPSGSKIVVDLEGVKANPYVKTVEAKKTTIENYPNSLKPKLSAIGFSDRSGYGCSMPLYHRESPLTYEEAGIVVKMLRHFLQRVDIEFVAHNSKFEIKWLRQYLDIFVENLVWDTMLMHYLGVTEEKPHNLKDLAWLETDMGGYDDALDETKPKGLDEGNYDLIPWDVLKVYLADDCDVTYRLLEKYEPMIMEDETKKAIWQEIMVPGYLAIHEMEHNGVYVDTEHLSRLEEAYPREIQRIEDKLREYPEVVTMERERKERWAERCSIGKIKKAERTEEQHSKFKKYEKYNPKKGGDTVNLGSNAQLGELLFERMGLHTVVLTDKGAYSTSEESLIYMKDQSDIIPLLLEYKKVKHLYSNFVSGMKFHLDENNFIHPNYNLHGTVTGRLSSSDPNAQQLPRQVYDPLLFQYWNDIKTLFTSRYGDDGVIVQFDYSQLELRILAVMTGDETLIDLYKSGADLHRAVAADSFGVSVEEVTKEQRTAAKKIQFGIVYQESAKGLSEDLRAEGIDMSEEQCQRFIDRYFRRFPKVQKWIKNIKKFAKKNKYVSSALGRIRHLDAIHSTDKSVANEAERQAVNAPIQSTGSDCTLMSMIEIDRWLRETNKKTKMCITVHDSIVFDTHKSEFSEVAHKIRHVMENLSEYNDLFKFLGDVPIVSEMEIGYAYGESFETSIEEVEEMGIDNYLQQQLAKKAEKEQEAYKKAEEKGRKIPEYCESYWNKPVGA